MKVNWVRENWENSFQVFSEPGIIARCKEYSADVFILRNGQEIRVLDVRYSNLEKRTQPAAIDEE